MQVGVDEGKSYEEASSEKCTALHRAQKRHIFQYGIVYNTARGLILEGGEVRKKTKGRFRNLDKHKSSEASGAAVFQGGRRLTQEKRRREKSHPPFSIRQKEEMNPQGRIADSPESVHGEKRILTICREKFKRDSLKGGVQPWSEEKEKSDLKCGIGEKTP